MQAKFTLSPKIKISSKYTLTDPTQIKSVFKINAGIGASIIDELEEEIKTKVDKTDFNDLKSNVETNTTNIELKADKTTVEDLNTTVVNNIGRGLSIGFDGYLQSGVIHFSSRDTYDIKNNYDYEVDLLFPVAGTISDDAKLIIHNNSEDIQLVTVSHKFDDGYATVKDLKQIMTYTDSVGYRWIFKARAKTSDRAGQKLLYIYPTVVNLDEKQDVIADLDDIRNGASLGATALQKVPDEYITGTELENYHDINKQDTLVSGTNIATINNHNLLEGGNITIESSGGTSDYDELENRPQINSVTLTGNKSLDDLGVQAKGDYATNTDLNKKQDLLTSANAGDNIIITTDEVVVPEGYTQLTYIQSTGTQGIDLGTLTSGSVEVDFAPTRLTGAYGTSYDGILGTNSAPQLGWYTTGWTQGNTGSAIPYPPIIGTRYTYRYERSSGKLYIDGQDTGLSRDGDLQLTLCYCEKNYKPAIVYEYRQYDEENNLIKRLIPCKKDDVIGMYDIINNNFYTNTGTGNFKAGIVVGDVTTITAIVPTKTSELTNDSGYIKSTYHDTTKQNLLTTITGYDSTKTQILKNVMGTLQWVDE